jgi:hypothetical protein
LKVTDTWKLAPCEQPSSTDIDRAHQRVFIGCRSGVMTVVNGVTGKIVDLSVAKLGPVPPPTKDSLRPRAPRIPGSFGVLAFGE